MNNSSWFPSSSAMTTINSSMKYIPRLACPSLPVSLLSSSCRVFWELVIIKRCLASLKKGNLWLCPLPLVTNLTVQQRARFTQVLYSTQCVRGQPPEELNDLTAQQYSHISCLSVVFTHPLLVLQTQQLFPWETCSIYSLKMLLMKILWGFVIANRSSWFCATIRWTAAQISITTNRGRQTNVPPALPCWWFSARSIHLFHMSHN